MNGPANRQIQQHTRLIDDLQREIAELRAASLQRVGWLRAPSSSDTNQLCKTPAGGIPAMTGEGTALNPYVFGSAGCYPIDVNTGETGATANVSVKNSTTLSIGGSVVIQVKQINGVNFVDVVEGCGS